MDERMARKVGEVKAFTVLGIELFEKGKDALAVAFGAGTIDSTVEKLSNQLLQIDEAMKQTEFADLTDEKCKKTKVKVGGMADTYIGDAWDDATELCEWLGFFEGAALVHWSLVQGKAEVAKLEHIVALCQEGKNLHQELLQTVVDTIRNLK